MPTTSQAATTRSAKKGHRPARTGRKPPLLRGSLPVLGHSVEFVRDLIGLLQRARDEVGEVAALKLPGRDVVLVTGPEGQEEVFRAPDDVLSPKAAYKLMVPVFGKGVVYDCDDDRMHEQLMMLMPALQNKRMRTYGEVISEEVDHSLESWGERGVVDIYEYMQTLTSYTSSRCLLGDEFRNEMSDEFAQVYHALERSIIPIAYLNARLPIPAFIKRDKARARLGEMVTEIVEKRRASGTRREDFMQTLMESSYKDGSKLTHHEITGMLVAAMFAGHHTSSVTAAWSILELLRNPEWMRKLREELHRVYGDGRPIDYASLRELHVTEWIIKETLRIHPPLFMLARVAMEDTTIRGYDIPKGTWILLSPKVAHRIESVFREPGEFCPHRFGPPKPEDQRPFAYIAFGGGRHKCLGNAFAILQVKTILAKIIPQYELWLHGDAIEDDFQGMVIGPKSPARIRYRRLEDAPKERRPAAEGAPAADEAVSTRPFRIVVDEDLCQGHGVCEGDAPELFTAASGKVEVLDERPDPSLRAKAEKACRYCPQRALSIVEE